MYLSEYTEYSILLQMQGDLGLVASSRELGQLRIDAALRQYFRPAYPPATLRQLYLQTVRLYK